MKLKTKEGGWNPYLAGALTGLLAIASVVATSQTGRTSFLGASTTFVRAAGYIERIAAPVTIASNAYYAKTQPVVDWQFMLLIGIFLGALASSFMDKSFAVEGVPPVWKERFGASIGKRAAGAIIGGMVAMVGARLADGCTSGHGLSGMMQLSVSGVAALVMFFGVGALTARLLYGRRAS